MEYCSYYQATITREKCWFFVAALRSFEYLAFDRTYDVQKSIFEFFVPASMEKYFLQFMQVMEERGIAHDLQKLPNRLQSSDAVWSS